MNFNSRALTVGLIFFAATMTGCLDKVSGTDNPTTPTPVPTVVQISGCTATSSANSWVPNVSNASQANHNSNITVSSSTVSNSGPLAGLGDSIAGHEVSVSFTVPNDLGLNGSVTLVGQVSGYPAGISPTAFAVLTSLSDGSNEYINLPRDGSGNVSCGGGGGFLSCSGGNCDDNSACQVVAYPSAYTDFLHYWQHQIPNGGYESVNRFPTCRWTQGATAGAYDPGNPACAFNTYFAGSSGHLPVGTYTAKYFLMTDGYASIPAGYNATLNVTVIQKKDTVDTSVGGAVDLNVVLVGSKNIEDSHTVAGQRNLNTMFYAFGNYLLGNYQGTNNANIKVGKINVYELTCQQGGDALATITPDQVGLLLQTGSTAIGSATEGKAINIFFVSEFSGNSAILGIDGSIGAPPLNGLQTSGLTVATFNMLALYNPGCHSTPCPPNTQDPDFYEMGNTIAHETGHFLGLNHPSEGMATMHDPVYDTPVCSALDPATNNQISINSCLNHDTNVFGPTAKTCNQVCTTYNTATGNYCPDARECSFNHMMWYQSKNYFPSTGAADGNQYSPDSGIIMNLSSFVQ